jgi:hypothetical protein
MKTTYKSNNSGGNWLIECGASWTRDNLRVVPVEITVTEVKR